MLRIEWSSGIVQELKNIPADQFLTVKEPTHLSFVGGESSSNGPQLKLGGFQGVKYAIESSINLADWSTVLVTTNLGSSIDLPAPGLKRQEFYRAVEVQQ